MYIKTIIKPLLMQFDTYNRVKIEREYVNIGTNM